MCTALLGPIALAAFLAYPLQVMRSAVRGDRSTRENWLRAGFRVIDKFSEMLGQLKFLTLRWLGRKSKLIEYKSTLTLRQHCDFCISYKNS